MNFSKWLENYADEKIFYQKEKTQKSDVSKILGFKKPLKKVAEGSYATLYQHPTDKNKLIKITSHDEDVKNALKSQKINSNNIVKLYDWKNGEKIKKIPELNSYAMIVEKIQGNPIIYTTSEIYDLSLSGKFELAADWLDYEPRKIQSAILEKYNNNNDKENGKLAELFRSLQQIKNFYKIDLVDFQDNIIDEGNRYVIVDLGF
jgi:hypothetical protein